MKNLTEKLVNAKKKHDWNLCSETCFRIIYGLPFDDQIELARLTMRRYLPVFEAKNIGILWPRELLGDITKWSIQRGRHVPNEPKDNLNPADASFLLGFDALLLAYQYKNDHGILTSSCVSAINAAIGALSSNVWRVDDPEAVILWERGEIPTKRTVLNNVAAIAVMEREWGEVINWLRKKKFDAYKKQIDYKKMEQFLEYWKKGGMALIVPDTQKMLGKDAGRP